MTYNRHKYAEVLSAPAPYYPDIESYNESQDKQQHLWQSVRRLQVDGFILGLSVDN